MEPINATTSVPNMYGEVYPDKLRHSEVSSIWTRRSVEVKTKASEELPKDTLGLALSGGGIRSATFCVGFLQELARKTILKDVDLLSTVSGGGYVGGFLGTLFLRNPNGGNSPPMNSTTVAQELSDNRSKPLRWLRENGRYISPNGAGDLVAILAVQIRNWCTVALVMATFFLMLFLATNFVRAAVSCWEPGDRFIRAYFTPLATSGFWCWSPLLLLLALPLLFAVVLGWCYWLVWQQKDKWLAWHGSTLIMLFATLIFGLLAGLNAPYRASAIVLAVLCLLTLVVFLLAVLYARFKVTLGASVKLVFSSGKGSSIEQAKHRELKRLLRNRLSSWLATTMFVAAGLGAFAVLDSLGQSVYSSLMDEKNLWLTIKTVVAASGFASILSFGSKLGGVFRLVPGGVMQKLPLDAISTVISVVCLGLFLLNMNILAHAVAWQWQRSTPAGMQLVHLYWGTALCAVLCWIVGQQSQFLNKTALQQLYGSRLLRAYFGASNPDRHQPEGFDVTNVIRGDDIWFDTYTPHTHGGPLHIINVTFNETCSAKSHVEQRDRKGLSFAVGPAGISVGRNDHATWEDSSVGTIIEPVKKAKAEEFAMFPVNPSQVENISIGHWIAISGAAVGTGMGSYSRLGRSLLLGLANVRLGYWWDSHVDPVRRYGCGQAKPSFAAQIGRRFTKIFTVQSYLLDEWLARFHGPARQHWYLSDGGHFENTGVYELIRRRVPYIVCCDCGADAQYAFNDLAGLVRKARIDFGAEIAICSGAQLDKLKNINVPQDVRNELGTVAEFSDPKTRKHGLLAWVCYEGNPIPKTFILFLKPAIVGDEPVDLHNYAQAHPDFPNESTGDQFFDEAQWESYRKLGEHIGQHLLVKVGGKWWFSAIDPVAFSTHCL